MVIEGLMKKRGKRALVGVLGRGRFGRLWIGDLG